MAAGVAPLERCGERLARLVSVWLTSSWRPSTIGRRDRRRRPPGGAAPEAPVLRSRADLGEAARALPARARAVGPRPAGRTLRPARLGTAARPDQRADPDDPDPEQRRHQRRGRVRGAAREVPVAAARSGRTIRAPAGAASACRTARHPTGRAVEHAPLPELVDTIRPGGLANQKAPRIQATLRRIREERGDYSLEFLADLDPLEARAWLTSIDGIGKKTASILLLFSFGQPLFPIDRHVERVARRVGLIPAKATRRRRPRPLPGHARARPDVRGARQPDPARPQGLPRPAPGARRLPARDRAAASWTRRRPDAAGVPVTRPRCRLSSAMLSGASGGYGRAGAADPDRRRRPEPAGPAGRPAASRRLRDGRPPATASRRCGASRPPGRTC